MSTVRQFLASLAVAAGIVACGGGTPTTPAELKASSIQVSAGNGQTVPVRAPLPTAPTLLVRDANGGAISGATVEFVVSAGGGNLAASSGTTSTAGVVALPAWNLGSAVGANTVTATVVGVGGVSATISATARLPRWTVLVYLAADNSLALAGLDDIDEMEAAGTDYDVQVAVQAEFSPQEITNSGATCAVCSAPNTLRFPIAPTPSHRAGPDNTPQVLGRQNSTLGSTLSSFVTWGKTTYPAERYALVLWNHGGGYGGLIQDESDGGSSLMSMTTLKTALLGVGPLDLVDFDMCLMGGYETLAMMQGIASTVLFSEETEPGAGDPYTPMLNGLQDDPTATTRIIAGRWVEAYNTSYEGDRNQTTKSAYDMQGFAAFEGALSTLATTLTGSVVSLRPAMSAASQVSQKFTIPQLTDLVNWMDSLVTRTSNPAVLAQIAALKTQATDPAFRIVSRARDGFGFGTRPVARATGLHVLMPSGTAMDALPDQGPESFANYQALFPTKPWTTLLQAYLFGPQRNYVDLGAGADYTVYTIWDSASISHGADVDMWVIEPDGSLYIPWLGVVTPNGTLTADSYDTGTSYEGYQMRRIVQVGRYKFYAHLYSDPMNFRPIYDLLYGYVVGAPLQSLFSPTYPRLSKVSAAISDPNFSLARVETGFYTDLHYTANLDIADAAVSGMASSRASEAFSAPVPGESGGADLTPAQLATVRAALEARRSGAASRSAGSPGLQLAVPPTLSVP